MILDNPNTDDTSIDHKTFGLQLLTVVLLLIGLAVFNGLISAVIPTMGFLGDLLLPILENRFWIGKIIFGFIIYMMSIRNKITSPSIGLLSIIDPSIGGLFYLLLLVTKKETDEGQIV
jgi:hypothetical protein